MLIVCLIFHQFDLQNPSGVPFLFHNNELLQDLQTLDANNSSVDNKDSIVRSVQLASECNAEKKFKIMVNTFIRPDTKEKNLCKRMKGK